MHADIATEIIPWKYRVIPLNDKNGDFLITVTHYDEDDCRGISKAILSGISETRSSTRIDPFKSISLPPGIGIEIFADGVSVGSAQNWSTADKARCFNVAGFELNEKSIYSLVF